MNFRPSGLVAMQKVVGSSPIIRFENPRKSGVSFLRLQTCVPDESQTLDSKLRVGMQKLASVGGAGESPRTRAGTPPSHGGGTRSNPVWALSPCKSAIL